ncbi:MAG: Spy/CpxP family protein refolding chaperone [Granulosicoccus sp.]
MKRHTKIILATITIVTIASTTAVVAGGRHGNLGDRMVSKIVKKLDLDEQQSSALVLLQEELRETRELMRANPDTDGQTLGDLIGAETFDQGAALEMITVRTTALQNQGPELVAAAAQFFDSLNAEQKQQLSERMSWFSEHRGKRHNSNN